MVAGFGSLGSDKPSNREEICRVHAGKLMKVNLKQKVFLGIWPVADAKYSGDGE